MAYDLFFRQTATCSTDRWQGPALGFTIPRDEWEAVPFTTPDMHPDLERYLGKKLRWHATEAGKLGFGGCAALDKRVSYVELSLPLHPLNVRNTMLTLSFLLQDIRPWQRTHDPVTDHLELYVGCGIEYQTIFGCASPEFQAGLVRLESSDFKSVMADMRRAWKATATPKLKRCADRCRARVIDGRFELDCFGDACDLSMYPDSTPEFSCHNLDLPFQQATLLAGLASLYQRVKLKM